MMSTAGITPVTTAVRAGDEELTRITGARVPTGVPTVIADPVVEHRRRNTSASRNRRRRALRVDRKARTATAPRGAAPEPAVLAA